MEELSLSYDSKKFSKKFDNVHRKYDDLAQQISMSRALSPAYLS